MKKTVRVLYFMPDMSLEPNAGNRARVISLLKYFKSKGFEVDYFGIRDYGPPVSENAVEEMLATQLVDRVFVGVKKPYRRQNIKRMFLHKIPEIFFNRTKNNSIFQSDVTLSLRRQFQKVLKENEYDYIVINYTTWADVVKDRKFIKGARLIIDTHDFLTIQQYNRNRKESKNKLGAILQGEINRLNYFDEVWAVSVDEFHIFHQLLDAEVKLVPNISNYEQSEVGDVDKKYDLLYVASDNPYNKASAKWFFDEVYPLLDTSIAIKVVGRICGCIDNFPNVEKTPFVEDLSEIYAQSRVVICPMLEGTGIKLKVLEAMSFGLPIVCNLRGVDGLPNKIDNGCLVTDDAREFADYANQLLTDPSKYSEIANQSKKLYSSYFLLERRLKQLDELFSKHA